MFLFYCGFFFGFKALYALLMMAQKSGEEYLSRVFQCEFVDSCETEYDDSFEGVSGDSWESAICKHLG